MINFWQQVLRWRGDAEWKWESYGGGGAKYELSLLFCTLRSLHTTWSGWGGRLLKLKGWSSVLSFHKSFLSDFNAANGHSRKILCGKFYIIPKTIIVLHVGACAHIYVKNIQIQWERQGERGKQWRKERISGTQRAYEMALLISEKNQIPSKTYTDKKTITTLVHWCIIYIFAGYKIWMPCNCMVTKNKKRFIKIIS